MRLTRKGVRQCPIKKIGFEEEYKKEKKETDIYNKLADLEDIEEELGIDLVTLFKVLKKWIFYKPPYFSVSKHEMRKVDFVSWEEKGVAEISREGNIITYPFSEYGITWALTKEELE